MVQPEWIATIVGALLCLVYSWFLSVVGQSQRVRFGKVSPAIGIVGALILAGMAVVGPSHIPKHEGVVLMSRYTDEGYPIFPKGAFRHAKLLSVVSRTIQEVGQRPSKDHLAYEHPTGKLEWVTKDQYKKLKTE